MMAAVLIRLPLVDHHLASHRYVRSDEHPFGPRPVAPLRGETNPAPCRSFRTDFAAIESNLEFIMSQLSRVPTRESWRATLPVMVDTACLVQTLALLFRF
jgi:hypothetical protein